MRCPECGGTLVSREIVGVTIDECGGCLGIWFDAGELETYRESLMPKKARVSRVPQPG